MQERLAAGNRKWDKLRGIFFSRTPVRLKRNIYIAVVSSAFLSAAEVISFTDAQVRKLCTSQTKKPRALLQGRASEQVDQRWSTATNASIYRSWGILPVGLALSIWRLVWFQKMLADPETNSHLLACLFGQIRCEQRCNQEVGMHAPPRWIATAPRVTPPTLGSAV